MHRTLNSLLPASRSAAAIGAAVALAAGAVAAAPAVQAAPAHTAGSGSSTATVLRAGLDVSLLGKTVDVPVNVSLSDVRAPADARETALTVTVGHGVELGRPVSILRAAVATAGATVDKDAAVGHADITYARLHVPGLPLLALVTLDAVSSRATCRAGHRPTASSRLAGVTVLGQHVSLSATGTTQVDVPGVGRVGLDLTRTTTTSTTAAATALHLKVHVNPLSLGVAEVSGDVTLAQATCRTPQADGSSTGGTTGGTTGGSGNGGATNGGASGGGSTGGGSANGGASNGGATSGGSATGGTSSSGGGSSSGSGGSTGSGSSGGNSTNGATGTSGGGGTPPVAGTGDLAQTGAGSSTPYLAGGAAVLVAAGAGVYLMTGRRRKPAARADDAEA